MTTPSAAQIQSDAARLITMAVWLGPLDSIGQAVGPVAETLTLNSTNLMSDLKAAGTNAPLNGASVITSAYGALANVVPTLYGGPVPSSKMKDMAAALRDLAGRMGTGAVTGADVAFLQGVAIYMTGIDDALGSGYLGVPGAAAALATLMQDPTSPSNLFTIATANGDTQGANALSSALALLNVLTGAIFPGGASVPAVSALAITNTINPDLHAIVEAKSPPVVTPVPKVPPGGGGGGGAGGGGGGSGTTKTGSSGMVVVGTVLAVGAIGTLAYLLATQHAPTARPQLARRNPSHGRSRSAPRNREDMTFTEWIRAANAFGVVFSNSRAGQARARRAWLKGEDPTEYAAHGRLIA